MDIIIRYVVVASSRGDETRLTVEEEGARSNPNKRIIPQAEIRLPFKIKLEQGSTLEFRGCRLREELPTPQNYRYLQIYDSNNGEIIGIDARDLDILEAVKRGYR